MSLPVELLSKLFESYLYIFTPRRARSHTPDRQTLFECCLVSKQWKDVAMAALWRDPLDHELDAKPETLVDLGRFRNSLLLNPLNGHLIRRLDFMDYSGFLADQDEWVASISSLCPNVRYARFGGDVTGTLPLLAIYDLTTTCNNLVDLELTFLVSDVVATEVESSQDEEDLTQDDDQAENNDFEVLVDIDFSHLEALDSNAVHPRNGAYRRLAQTLMKVDHQKFQTALGRLRRLSWMVEMKTIWTYQLARFVVTGAHHLETLLLGESQDDISRMVLDGVAPHCSNLKVFSHTGGEDADQDEATLIKIARGSPKLKHLSLWGCTQVPRVAVFEFIKSCKNLETLRLDFLSDHQPIDDILSDIGDQSKMLTSLAIPGLCFKSATLAELIQKRGSRLEFLDISRCLDTPSDSDQVLMAISQYTRYMKTLLMSGCLRASDLVLAQMVETVDSLDTFVPPAKETISQDVIDLMQAKWKLQWRP
ncbi:hypothetical protein HDV05_008442 [Chytridiales sp. JEL 0842]|nr:hypothetical protein HDV05_008442 [Chytridiales sp. JEL 0842]